MLYIYRVVIISGLIIKAISVISLFLAFILYKPPPPEVVVDTEVKDANIVGMETTVTKETEKHQNGVHNSAFVESTDLDYDTKL